MIKYPLDYNPILEYWAQISNGDVTVGRKIKLTYEKIVRDLDDTESEYFYSAKRATMIYK